MAYFSSRVCVLQLLTFIITPQVFGLLTKLELPQLSYPIMTLKQRHNWGVAALLLSHYSFSLTEQNTNSSSTKWSVRNTFFSWKDTVWLHPLSQNVQNPDHYPQQPKPRWSTPENKCFHSCHRPSHSGPIINPQTDNVTRGPLGINKASLTLRKTKASS